MGWGDGTSNKKVKLTAAEKRQEKKDAKRDKKFDKCTKCRAGQKYCGKHLKEMRAEASTYDSLHDSEGRNRNGIRYDSNSGKRIWD